MSFSNRIHIFATTRKAWIASRATIVALGLFAMQQALRLPAGYGIEDFMGWASNTDNAGGIRQAIIYWDSLPVFHNGPTYYLLLDTFCFIPLYSLLIYGATSALHIRFTPGNWLLRALWRITPYLLLLLVLDDLAENLSGFSKLGYPVPHYFGEHANVFNMLKFPFLFAALLPALYYMLAWWLGFHCSDAVVQLRREKWHGYMGVVGRSRYVLGALALFAGFTLVMDQCRDVVLSMVDGDIKWPMRVTVIVLNALAGAMFAYSCFLWTRLVCMVERISLPQFTTGAVSSSVGYFAQQWARFLALLPALMMVILLGYVTGDALASLRMRGLDNVNVIGWLSFFVALVVLLCWLFVKIRQSLHKDNLASYYNAMGIGHLLEERSRLPRGVPAVFQPLADLLSPTALPLVALSLLLLLRLMPGLQPQAFAELCLSLTWWLGVAGVLSLIEQRTSVPWGLFLLILIGVLGLYNLTNNHQFSLLAHGAASDSVKEYPALVGGVIIGLLAAVWWLLTHTHRKTLSSPTASGGLLFLAYTLLLVVLLFCGLRFAEYYSEPSPMLTAKVKRDLLTTKLHQREDTSKVLYVVAAEGGGIRSAYWTALMLAKLHEAPKQEVAKRLLVVSGVSGGALGAAAYRACLRQPERPVSECIKKGFEKMDPLSPMLEAFMMEDVLARIVPTSLCDVPGCAYLSRALPFERAWIAAFRTMAQPLSPAWPGEPELMLNSTAVETGNRNTFSTVKLEPYEIPTNNDIIEELDGEPRLVTAAHAAARFPFINPLAVAKGPGKKDFRHLADGGYYDNSGVTALADLMPTIRERYKTNPIRLILIRNGQPVADCEKKRRLAPLAGCLKNEAPAHQDRDHALMQPLKTPGQTFYADAFGPPATLLHVSGVGAHGRQPAGSALWYSDKKDPNKLQPCTLDQESSVNLVPLGWYLSESARLALEQQANKVDLSACLKEFAPDAPATAALP